MTSTDEYCLGIDLGTTYCCFGIYKNNNVEIITNDMGNRTLPSYVSFTDEERYIGESAKNMSSQNPINTIYDAKRLIGRKYSDESVQDDIRHYTFTVDADESDKPVICAEYLGLYHKFYPEQISAMILEKIKILAEKYTNTQIKKAVITVPAYFNDSQRNSTRDAGRIAGLEVMRIINEPTAAAIAYGLNESKEKNILVYDLGGGTLDVTILTIDNGIFEVKSTSGDTHLGGEDFDNKLCDYVLITFADKHIIKSRLLNQEAKDEINKKFNLNNPISLINLDEKTLNDNKIEMSNKSKEFIDRILEYNNINKNKKLIRKVKSACEIAKKTLSMSTTTNIIIDNFYNNIDLNVTVTRSKFEEICKTDFDKALIPVDKALKDAKMIAKDIQDVVLVGGSTRIPKIQEMLNNIFPDKLKSNINPDEAVAYGATIQAAILNGQKSNKLDQIVLLDVTPLSVGLETAGGVMSMMIKRNTSIPATKEETFSTYSDNQSGVTIKIYEGERTMTRDNNLLGVFELTGIPPLPRGTPRIKVTFNIDENGIMSINALEESTNKQNKIIIENKKGRLSDDAIQNMIKSSEKFSEIDKKNKKKVENKINLESYINSVRKTIDDEMFKSKIEQDKYIEIMDRLGEIENKLEEENTEYDFELIYTDIESYITPILKTYL
jgi:L1 cell adhesion molecule like protein